LAGLVRGLALAKKVKIYPMVFGSCGAFRGGQEKAKGLGSVAIDPSYVSLAEATGGQALSLNSGEAGQITQIADALVRANAVDLLSVRDSAAGKNRAYTVAIDSSLTRATLALGGASLSALIRPDGTTVQSSDPDVQVSILSSGAIYTLLQPSRGTGRSPSPRPGASLSASPEKGP